MKYFKVEAHAISSKTYKGRVNFGTYSDNEKLTMLNRIARLTDEGYTNIEVIEVPNQDR
jgi:hypothetical protein